MVKVSVGRFMRNSISDTPSGQSHGTSDQIVIGHITTSNAHSSLVMGPSQRSDDNRQGLARPYLAGSLSDSVTHLSDRLGGRMYWDGSSKDSYKSY